MIDIIKNADFSEDIKLSDKKMSLQLSDDFDKGSKLLEDIGATVGIFGSARLDEKNKYYQKAQKLSKMLADNGFHITSGGSGGIMEAANKGAYESGKAHSFGFNIVLPFEQNTNKFTTRSATLNHFCVRKRMLIKNAIACVAFPGGYGTLDEIFNTLALVQTKKILPIKIYLYGEKFWGKLKDFINTSLVDYNVISPEDADILHIGDDLEYIFQDIKKYAKTYANTMKNAGLENTQRYELIKKQIDNF